MANCLIAYDNAVTAGLSFYPWPSSYNLGLAALGTVNLSQKWVSASLAASETRMQFALSGAPSVALFALVNHNLSLAATVRLTGSNNNWASTVYDSGAVAAFPAGTTAASRKRHSWTWWHRLSAPTACGQWRLEISDASNPAGYVSAGRLLAAQGLWQPSINMLQGALLGFEGGAEPQVALNGGEYFTERPSVRVANFRLQQPTEEMLSNAMDVIACGGGPQRELLFVYDPADGVHAVRRTVFGRLRKLSAIEEPQYGRLDAAFEIKELV